MPCCSQSPIGPLWAADEKEPHPILDTHHCVRAFVKNAGLGFSIPYIHNGQPHDYVPDFIVRLNDGPALHLILETKGFDELAEIKSAAAQRWTEAVNEDGCMGTWRYSIARRIEDVRNMLDELSGAPPARRIRS